MTTQIFPFFLRNGGYCWICDEPTMFEAHHFWLRDHYFCQRCGSIPRERALFRVLGERFPNWRQLRMHESSPADRPNSKKMKNECAGYIATQFFPGIQSGTMHSGYRCENLERQTFEDQSFDLVVTQDVMEHVLDPKRVFCEIARTLRPGGAHIFTTPIYGQLEQSRVRARSHNEVVEHLFEPVYHHNPVDPKGSLVTIDYGQDIVSLIEASSGCQTEIVRFNDFNTGLVAEFLNVLVSTKPTTH